MCDDRGKPTLELIHLAAEDVIIIVKPFAFNVHDVVVGRLEHSNGFYELDKNFSHVGSQCLALGAAHFNFFKLVELNNCLHEVQDVVAALQETVQS